MGGPQYLCQATKYSRVEADESPSETTKLSKRLQIRFEMDTPVLGDFAVTNGLVPEWSASLLSFHGSRWD